MGEDDMGDRGDVKKTPPPSYDDVVEMTNVVKVKEADDSKKGDDGKDDKDKKEGKEDKPAEPEDPPVGVFELVMII